MKGTREFLVTYSVDSGMFTNQQGAVLHSLVFGFGTLARGLAIIASRYIAPPYILLIDAHGQLLFALLCLVFGTRSRIALWIFAPGLGFFRELMFPTGFAWTGYYIKLLGVFVGLIEMVAQFVNMGLIPMQGYLYDNTAIESIFYTTAGFGFLELLVVYAMSYYASRKGARKNRIESESQTSEVQALNTHV